MTDQLTDHPTEGQTNRPTEQPFRPTTKQTDTGVNRKVTLLIIDVHHDHVDNQSQNPQYHNQPRIHHHDCLVLLILNATNSKLIISQGCGSGLILTGAGSNLSGLTGPDPTFQDKPDPDPCFFLRPDKDPDTSVLKIFHLFYDDF